MCIFFFRYTQCIHLLLFSGSGDCGHWIKIRRNAFFRCSPTFTLDTTGRMSLLNECASLLNRIIVEYFIAARDVRYLPHFSTII